MVDITDKTETAVAGRVALLEELHRRYKPAPAIGRLKYFRFLRKKYSWVVVVSTAVFFKRCVDLVGALIGLILLAPLFVLVAAAIKMTDGGPVFYRQTRTGQWGREFSFPKFRSMWVDADKMQADLLNQNNLGNSITFKMKHDPRVTPVGRIIRKFSIDELPQLWCVLRGDMSLVGPRPALPSEVAAYSLADRRRLDIKPGLTCIWQVSGRSNLPFEKQVQLDVQYIESQSLWLDLKLLVRTIPAVVFGYGAY